MTTATSPRPAIQVGETLRNVDWETYCRFRDDPANDHLRMTYLDGDLAIESRPRLGVIESRRVFFVVQSAARASRIRLRAMGPMTIFQETTEPNRPSGYRGFEGFYLGEEVGRVRGKTELDLSVDPPPSLALEVDNTGNSETSLLACTQIGVPEVWRFDVAARTIWFGRLDEDRYQEIDRSFNLPRLTPALLLEALEDRRQAEDDTDWLDRWARALPEPA